MGLLSSILSVGGAIIGGAVGGPAGASLGASLGGAVGGAVSQSGGSNAATAAQVAAQQQARQDRLNAANQVGQLQDPYLQAGYGAVNALTGRLGLNPSTVARAVQTANGPGGPTATAASANALNSGGGTPGYAVTDAFPTPSSGAPAQGQGSGIATSSPPPDPSTLTASLPQSVDANGNIIQPTGTPGVTSVGDATGMLAQPNPSAMPANALTGAAAGTDPGTYGSTANPNEPGPYVAPTYAGAGTYATPTPFSYTLADYTASPAYQYQQDQARKSILASSAATGALQSGAALKELQDRAQNIAYQDFSNERAFAAGQNQTNVGNALNAFNTNATSGLNTFNANTTAGLNGYDVNQNAYQNDRNYLTNRSDTQTSNLFRLSGAGQDAAGIVSNADANVGTANANGAVAAGNANATNALTQGQIGSNLATGIGGLIASNPNALLPQPTPAAANYNLTAPPASTYANTLRF